MNLKRILAIDFGVKRIGLAIGDSESSIATPFKTIKNNGYENCLFKSPVSLKVLLPNVGRDTMN